MSVESFLRAALGTLLLLHGLIHLIGFASAFGFARLDAMPSIPRAAGAVWLATALLFSTAALLFVAGVHRWWIVVLIAAAASQALIAGAWDAAKFGTIVNIVAVLAAAPGVARALPHSLEQRYVAAVEQGLSQPRARGVLREADIAHVPPIVRTYLRNTGAIGRDRVSSVRVVFDGRIRAGADSSWMPMRVEQYNFFDRGVRIFHLESNLHGIPIEGLHLFDPAGATMRIRAASILTVAEAAGPEMDQSETVTQLNDMCLLAPSTLADSRIAWEGLDTLRVRAAFTLRGLTVRAVLRFSAGGDLLDFESDDRYQTTDGRSYTKHRWSTPVHDVREIEGRRIWTRGEATWTMPDGPFTYAELYLRSIAYNPKAKGPAR